ncbi:MAG: branched-chain amino acid transaminase [Chloroflexota bacterium]
MASATMFPIAYFEGDFIPFSDAKISIGTHAVQYGTGAFAGVRGYLDSDGETINIFRLPDHCARLLNSARLIRAELPFSKETLGDLIAELVARNSPDGDVYIRPFIYKSSVQLTPRLKGLDNELAVYMMPLGDYIDTRGVRAGVSSWARVSDHAIPGRGKISGSYINAAMAKDEAEEKGVDEAILLDSSGHVAEGSACNLFIVRDGALCTAPITGDILEGITRRTVMMFAKDLGIPVVEREIDRSELYLLEEAFFCGTGVQIAPIKSIDGRTVSEHVPGPVTKQIADLFYETVRGTNPKYAHLLTKVKPKVAATAD